MCSKIMANNSPLAKLWQNARQVIKNLADFNCQNARQVIKNLEDFKGTQEPPLLLAELIQQKANTKWSSHLCRIASEI